MTETVVEILLVEDNPSDVELTLHSLRSSNLTNHIEVVRDGVEALDFIFCTGSYAHRYIDNGPNMILLDLKLPKIDGMEVLQRVKSDPRTRMIPVVVFTSSRVTNSASTVTLSSRWTLNSSLRLCGSLGYIGSCSTSPRCNRWCYLHPSLCPLVCAF